MNRHKLFYQYELEPNPEHWRNFPELMWDLGFEMDCHNSAPSFDELDWQTHTEKEIQDQLLCEMKTWSTQEVGNYIFSRYRELTHWSYDYPEEKGAYFFERSFPILQSLLNSDWETRNTIPTLEAFSKMVTQRFKKFFGKHERNQVEEFLQDEGQFYIQSKYNEYIKKANKGNLAIPKFYGICITETIAFLYNMF